MLSRAGRRHRLDGNIDPLSNETGADWYARYVQDTYHRFEAHALTFTIGQGGPVTRADVGAAQWAELERSAVPGTARL
ncbi:MAG: hypothetical protein M3067_02675 [Chloroflexota bacterium]|nr:hypothetical protein [Chloroflexota bacterium]